MNKILCIGEALIDMICTDRGSLLSAGNHFLKKPGGAPTNVAAAIAALGGNAELIAKVGTDPFGTHLIEVMQEFKISTKWVIRDPGHFTTFAFVSLLENGERDFYFNRGADGHLNQDEIKSLKLDEFSIAHFGSATAFLPAPLQHTYLGLLQQSLQRDVFISFDPNYRPLLFPGSTGIFIEQAWNFLTSCHFFKMSEEEALLLTEAYNLDDAVEILQGRSNAIFAITLGKDGALLSMNGQKEIIPGITIKPVDTTGAGDAFVGAVLYQLSKYSQKDLHALSFEEWKIIISNANKAGAKTCEYMGAMEGFRQLGLIW